MSYPVFLSHQLIFIHSLIGGLEQLAYNIFTVRSACPSYARCYLVGLVGTSAHSFECFLKAFCPSLQFIISVFSYPYKTKLITACAYTYLIITGNALNNIRDGSDPIVSFSMAKGVIYRLQAVHICSKYHCSIVRGGILSLFVQPAFHAAAV